MYTKLHIFVFGSLICGQRVKCYFYTRLFEELYLFEQRLIIQLRYTIELGLYLCTQTQYFDIVL